MLAMAGELLFRILERPAFEALLQRGTLTTEGLDTAFLDRGDVSLTDLIGENYVVIDGPAFASDAPWLYDEQEAFDELSPEEAEWATLSVPSIVLTDWRLRLQSLPNDGQVARSAAKIRDALLGLMDRVQGDAQLMLTVECLL
jgi:hypothetical protein